MSVVRFRPWPPFSSASYGGFCRSFRGVFSRWCPFGAHSRVGSMGRSNSTYSGSELTVTLLTAQFAGIIGTEVSSRPLPVRRLTAPSTQGQVTESERKKCCQCHRQKWQRCRFGYIRRWNFDDVQRLKTYDVVPQGSSDAGALVSQYQRPHEITASRIEGGETVKVPPEHVVY
jgi:hypothetical protein